ncbi:hypothetical protein SAMN05660912_00739 [Pseudomonas sp. LAMO17WK12:I1]|nr:hypothetical protein SAMN05660912_00739 [Pseudomonas sp. LAMO17WK12:I1]
MFTVIAIAQNRSPKIIGVLQRLLAKAFHRQLLSYALISCERFGVFFEPFLLFVMQLSVVSSRVLRNLCTLRQISTHRGGCDKACQLRSHRLQLFISA